MHYLGLVDRVSPGVTGLQARCRRDCAVDIGDRPTSATDEMVVIVGHPILIQRRCPGGLDPSQETRSSQGSQHVVDRLARDAADPFGDQSGDPIGIEVRAVWEGLQDGDPLDRHAQAGCGQSLSGSHQPTVTLLWIESRTGVGG